MKTIFLFWAWKTFGAIAEGYFVVHNYFYEKWGENVTPPLVKLTVKDALVSEVENEIAWKRGMTDHNLAKHLVERMVRYMPSVLVKGGKASLSNCDLPKAPDPLD